MDNSKGFSLVTLAIIIVAFSAAIVGLMSYNQAYPVMDKKIRDVSDLNATVAAIQRFATSKNYIPCPADPRLPESDANYLKSAGTYPVCSNSMPNKAGQYYKGLIPTRTLGISDSMAFDRNNNYISYLVDTGLSFLKVNTDGTCVSKTGGLNSGCSIYNAAQFQQFGVGQEPNIALISHGENVVGAFRKGLTSITSFSKTTHQIPSKSLANGNKFDSLPQATNHDLYLSNDIDEIVFKSLTPLGNPATTSSTPSRTIYDDTVLPARIIIGGNVRCWGNNTNARSDVTSLIATGNVVKAFSTGGAHSCVLKTDGTVECWGDNSKGQTTVPGGLSAKAIAAGNVHTCAINSNDYVQCWGNNTSPYYEATVPPAIAQGTGTVKVKAINTNYMHTCALTVNGNVYCWGRNWESTQATVPTAYTEATNARVVRSVVTGPFNTCVIKTDDMVDCWGDNSKGQTTIPSSITTGGAVSLAISYYQVCAIKKSNGGLECWGTDGTYLTTLNWPTTELNVKAVSMGLYHACIIKSNNTPYCWGRNTGPGEGVVSGTTGLPTVSPTVSTEIMRGIDSGDANNCYMK